jgi:hypothetical protein
MRPGLNESLLSKSEKDKENSQAKDAVITRGLLSLDPVHDYNTALVMRVGVKKYLPYDKNNWRPVDWELETIMLSAVGIFT